MNPSYGKGEVSTDPTHRCLALAQFVIAGDRHGEHIADFLAGGPGPDQRFHVQPDTGLAFGGHGDSERDEFLCLEVEHTAFLDGLAKPAEGACGVRDKRVERAQIMAGGVDGVGPAHVRAFWWLRLPVQNHPWRGLALIQISRDARPPARGCWQAWGAPDAGSDRPRAATPPPRPDPCIRWPGLALRGLHETARRPRRSPARHAETARRAQSARRGQAPAPPRPQSSVLRAC